MEQEDLALNFVLVSEGRPLGPADTTRIQVSSSYSLTQLRAAIAEAADFELHNVDPDKVHLHSTNLTAEESHALLE
jgi:hypothetical protein